jgi:hypothetical protein
MSKTTIGPELQILLHRVLREKLTTFRDERKTKS